MSIQTTRKTSAWRYVSPCCGYLEWQSVSTIGQYRCASCSEHFDELHDLKRDGPLERPKSPAQTQSHRGWYREDSDE